MKLSRKKFAAFAAIAIAFSLCATLIALLAADLVLHWRAEKSAGLNRYGYRGPVVGRKQPGELRVVMLGGSTVFGYGVAWNESIPAYLELLLGERLGKRVTVVNLGYNNEGAFAFLPNLEDFEYLDYDVVVLYEGYNDLPGDAGVNRSVYRRNSAVYRLTGYFPILPLYLDEKAMALRHGNLGAAYANAHGQNGRAVFRPNLAQRTSAAALETVNAMTRMLDSQLSKVAQSSSSAPANHSTLGCNPPWISYCESIAGAVRFARARGDAVVVVSQPKLVMQHARDVHPRQQAMLAGMMARHFAQDPGVVWSDQSAAVDLNSIDATFDAMHLKPQANAQVAIALVEPVMAAMQGAGVR